MKVLNRQYGFSDILPAVSTGAADVDTLGDALNEAELDGWNQWINKTLIEWGRNRSLIEDEDVEPPSNNIIQLAFELAGKMRDAGIPSPTWVVPAGDGGIFFEWHNDSVTRLIEITSAGKLDLTVIKDHHVIFKKPSSE